jgi:hypothetical protein
MSFSKALRARLSGLTKNSIAKTGAAKASTCLIQDSDPYLETASCTYPTTQVAGESKLRKAWENQRFPEVEEGFRPTTDPGLRSATLRT